jgi:hypothetical protein
LGFKEAPINVKQKGVLHSSWAKLTQSVRLLQVAEQGMYMNTNLERVRRCPRYVSGVAKNIVFLSPTASEWGHCEHE